MLGGIIGLLTGNSDRCLPELASDTFEGSGKRVGPSEGLGLLHSIFPKAGRVVGLRAARSLANGGLLT